MPTTSPEKITLPAAGDAYQLTADLAKMMASARTVVPVTNVTDRAAVVSALVAAGTPVSATRPLYVHRSDAAAGEEHEYTIDGTTWRTLPGIGFGGVWQAYTPPLGGFTLGNGTVVGRYLKVLKSLDVSIAVTMGSTTVFTSDFSLGIPPGMNFASGRGQTGTAIIIDASTGFGYASVAFSSGTGFFLGISANFVAGPSRPMPWASGDSITFNAHVEVQ